MLKLLMIFSILISGCAGAKKANKLELKWTFFEAPPGQTRACLGEDDTKELREALIRCGELSD